MPLRASPSSIEDLLHHAEWVRRLAVRLAPCRWRRCRTGGVTERCVARRRPSGRL